MVNNIVFWICLLMFICMMIIQWTEENPNE